MRLEEYFFIMIQVNLNFYKIESTGFINKKDIRFLFFEIKEALAFRNHHLNEKLFMNKMLQFYTNSKELVPFKEMKLFFYELLNDIKPNTVEYCNLSI